MAVCVAEKSCNQPLHLAKNFIDWSIWEGFMLVRVSRHVGTVEGFSHQFGPGARVEDEDEDDEDDKEYDDEDDEEYEDDDYDDEDDDYEDDEDYDDEDDDEEYDEDDDYEDDDEE